MSEIDGFETIKNEDKSLITELIEKDKASRTRPLAIEYVKKKTIQIQAPSDVHRSKLNSTNLPCMNIMFTNADQLTTLKMTELNKRVMQEKPMVIAICEVKPKNSKERAEQDYIIPGYSFHPLNLDSDTGRGVVIYIHSSLDKSVIQVIPELGFEEACLLEIRVRGGDSLLFGCFYRSPTPTFTSDKNNDNLNHLLRRLSDKNYSA